MKKFRDGLAVGALYAGFGGFLGVVVAVGAAAVLSLPFATAATVGIGVCGLAATAFGAVVSAVAPNGGDWRAASLAGLALTAAMTCGTHAALSSQPSPPSPPPKSGPPAISMRFNGVNPAMPRKRSPRRAPPSSRRVPRAGHHQH